MSDVIEAVTDIDGGRILIQGYYEYREEFPEEIIVHDDRDRDIDLSVFNYEGSVEEYRISFTYHQGNNYLTLSGLELSSEYGIIEVDILDTPIRKNCAKILVDEPIRNLIEEFYFESIRTYDWRYYIRYIRSISSNLPGMHI
jgi:hypothetical protein